MQRFFSIGLLLLSLWLLVIATGQAILRCQPSPAQMITYASRRQGDTEIFTMLVDGTLRRRLTFDEGANLAPRWSPDGQWIAYLTAHRGGRIETHLIRPNRTDHHIIPTSLSALIPARWSPQGDALLLTSFDQGDILVWQQGQLTNLTQSAAIEYNPSWSPDGTWIVHNARPNGNSEIYKRRRDGTGEQQLTDHPGEDYLPLWSPDGEWIAFTRREMQEADDNIMLVRADGSGEQFLTRREGNEVPVAWSPDGAWLLFIQYAYDGINDFRGEIWLTRRDGSESRRLSDELVSTGSFGWSREWLMFERVPNANPPLLYLIRPDGSAAYTLRDGSNMDVTASFSPLIDLPYRGSMLLLGGLICMMISLSLRLKQTPL